MCLLPEDQIKTVTILSIKGVLQEKRGKEAIYTALRTK